jgi:hypothetical protein
MVIVYWALAFVIGAAIPQIQTISGLIAAVCIMQFSYTFPPLFLFMFLVRRDTLLAGGSWKVVSRQSSPVNNPTHANCASHHRVSGAGDGSLSGSISPFSSALFPWQPSGCTALESPSGPPS